MCSAYQIDIILLVEVFDNYLAECVRDASVVLAPVNDVFFGVGGITPQKIAQQAAIWHVGGSQNLIDLLQIVQLGREPTVNAKNFTVHDCSES